MPDSKKGKTTKGEFDVSAILKGNDAKKDDKKKDDQKKNKGKGK